MSTEASTPQEQLAELVAQQQEPGVAQAIATYEAVERAYFQAVAAEPSPVTTTTYATTTIR